MKGKGQLLFASLLGMFANEAHESLGGAASFKPDIEPEFKPKFSEKELEHLRSLNKKDRAREVKRLRQIYLEKKEL